MNSGSIFFVSDVHIFSFKQDSIIRARSNILLKIGTKEFSCPKKRSKKDRTGTEKTKVNQMGIMRYEHKSFHKNSSENLTINFFKDISKIFFSSIPGDMTVSITFVDSYYR